ncbi:hypothetical protein GVAV_001210 [Gurleya vavrai]
MFLKFSSDLTILKILLQLITVQNLFDDKKYLKDTKFKKIKDLEDRASDCKRYLRFLVISSNTEKQNKIAELFKNYINQTISDNNLKKLKKMIESEFEKLYKKSIFIIRNLDRAKNKKDFNYEFKKKKCT